MRHALVIGLVGSAFACGSFEAGDSKATPPSDAGVTTDGASADAEAAPDGGDGDAVADATPPVRDPGDRFCSDPSQLCADYEGPPTGAWAESATDFLATGGSAASAAPGEGGLLGRAFRSNLPSGSESMVATHTLTTNVVQDLDVTAALFIEKPANASSLFNGAIDAVVLFAVSVGKGAKAPLLEVRLLNGGNDSGQLGVRVSVNGIASSLTAGIVPYGTWLSLEVSTDFFGDAQGASMVLVDGTLRASTTLARMKESEVGADKKTRVTLGVQRTTVTTNSSLVVRYDNVTAKP